MLKYGVIILLIFYAATYAQAQDYSHFTLWSRLRVAKTFTEKWEAEIDLQYRRQANDNVNILSLPLAKSVRLWAYYHPTSNWTIGFSPFTWFHNHALVTTPADKLVEWDEYRVYLYGEYRTSVAKKLILFSRAGAEPMIQVRSGRNNSSVTRLRWREQLNIQAWRATQFFVGGELFLNSFGSEKPDVYNQSRAFAGLQYYFGPRLLVSGGYMLRHISVPQKNYQKGHDLLLTALVRL